jgi:hypothetical protein
MLEIKRALLATGLVEDNQYLDEYVELVINNLDTPKTKGATQEHHIIPVFCYATDDTNIRVGKFSSESNKRRRELLKLANADSTNKRLQLNFSDHIKAHILLTKCGKSYPFILNNANACVLMLNLARKAVDDNIVQDLSSDENIQKAYSYVSATKTKPTDNEEYYQKSINNLKRGGAERKVRCIETGTVYDSIKDAEDANNLTRYRLNQILTGRRKQIPGLTFEYIGGDSI